MRVAGREFTDVDTLAASDLVAGVVALRDTLRRPAVTALVGDRAAGYRFDTWEALAVALGDWDGEPPTPLGLGAFRVPERQRSVRVNWNPARDVTPDNVGTYDHAFRTAWSNCGQTAEYLIGRIQDLGGDVQREDTLLIGQGEGARLAQCLLTVVTRRTLINVVNDQVHEFTIEKRSEDQGAILQQGYLSGYSAIWWAGLDAELIDAPQTARQDLLDMRADYGPTRAIDLITLGANLTRFLAAEQINSEAARAAWRDLPFHPNGALPSANPPSFQVRVWSINEPDTVRETVRGRLGDTLDATWISQLVMLEVNEFTAW
jgi:hypothetical protein